MSKRIFLVGASFAAALGLAGCAALERFLPSPCTQGVCKLGVSVESCTAAHGIKVDREYLRVTESNNIEWTLTTPGYVFVQDRGISFSYNPVRKGKDSRVFTNPSRSGDGKKFSWRDNYDGSPDERDEYKYSVHLQREGGELCRPYDPWISNQ